MIHEKTIVGIIVSFPFDNRIVRISSNESHLYHVIHHVINHQPKCLPTSVAYL